MTEDDRMTQEQKDDLKMRAEFRIGYIRWLASQLVKPGHVDQLIRSDAAKQLLLLIGDEQ